MMNTSSITGFRKTGAAFNAIASIKANSIKWVSILIAVLAVFLLSMPVWAATITVNTTVDEDNSSGDCSVREALGSVDGGNDIGGCTASGTYGSSDTVILQSGETYVLAGGYLETSTDVTIDGQGATVNGDNIYRVFYICPSGSCAATVTINNLTITNGSAVEGAGIYNNGTLTLNSSTISDNDSAVGAGIYNNGTLTLNDSTIGGSGTPNAAVFGSGIYNLSGTVTLNSSTISENTAEENGGGIYNTSAGAVTLNNSTIGGSGTPNMAASDGSGIYNDGGTVDLINNSAVSGNTANNDGGGIYNAGAGTVTLTDTTISANNADGLGGGIYNSDGTVTFISSIINDNTSLGWGVFGVGGGIYNAADGILNVNNSSTISNNTSSGTLGGFGGGIYNDGTLNVNNSAIGPANEAKDGGGVYNEGTLTIVNSTISGNVTNSNGDGGGISNINGTLTITDSTVSGNTTTFLGGGIYNEGTESVLNVNNSTISGNTGNEGGGIFLDSGAISLNNATITNNTSITLYGGGILIGEAAVNVQNSILAGNIESVGGGFPDCDGDIVSGGYNLIQDTTGCTINGDTTGNITGQDSLLSALADNGGPSFTHALQSGSLAIDAGNPAGCTDHNGDPLTDDQRGVTRPQDGDDDSTARCDIGAYEFVLPPDIDVSDSVAPADDLQIDFGEVNAGSSSTHAIVTLTNQGQQSLMVSNVVVSGTDTGLFSIDFSVGTTPCNGLSIVIAAGQNCTLAITFTPQSAGAKTASVDISSDDPDEGTVNVALSGTGITPPADDTPAPAGGGGGGCTLSNNRPFDPLMPLMIGLALAYFARSRDKRSAHFYLGWALR